MQRTRIEWPDEHHPDRCPVYAYNEMAIGAPAERVWAWLIRAPLWPTFYVNAKRVVIETEPKHELRLGAVFSWTTFLVRLRTNVAQFEPPARIAWTGTRFGSTGWHGWLIEARGPNCFVYSEETQHGPVPSLLRWPLRKGLHHYHQVWLEGLDRMARSGWPPGV